MIPRVFTQRDTMGQSRKQLKLVKKQLADVKFYYSCVFCAQSTGYHATIAK